MSFFKTLFLTACLLLPLNAAAGDAAAVADKLQDRYEKVSSLSADFTQEVFSKSLKSTQTSGGKVFFKKPGKMRWTYSEPIKDEIVSNGKVISVYQPDLNQVMEREIDPSASNIGTDFLSGVGNLKRDFDIAIAEENEKTCRLSLTPKEPQPNIKRIFLELDKGTFIITKTVVEDLFGNETRVSLRDMKFDANIKDSVFEFKAPKGAKVVKP